MTSTHLKLHPGLNLHHADPDTHHAAQNTIFGFWIFLMSDAIIFALLFATYATMVGRTAGGPTGVDLFNLQSVLAQSALLLTSTLTVGFAALAMKYGDSRRRLTGWLLVTLLLGLGFLALEVRDLASIAGSGAVPQRSGYLSAFFALVGAHGLHVFAACLWLMVLILQVRLIGPTRAVKLRLMRLVLFWHFLDIVWVGVFSFVFLGAFA